MSAEKIRINNLVPSTWNRFKVNDIMVDLPGEIETGLLSECDVQTSGAAPEDWKMVTGCGAELSRFLDEREIKPVLVGHDGEKTVTITKSFTRDSADVICFEAQEGETINVLNDLTSSDETEATAVVRIMIKAKKNSVVNIAQIIRPGKGLRIISDIGATAEEKARINVVQVVYGGSEVYTGCRTELNGIESEAYNRVGTVRTNGQTHDMNYVVKHFGKRTLGRIDITGALSDKARKTFRGTIDFICGCTGSDGGEAENMLLLDNTVINKTVPLILCTEENVAGSHGATIGKPAQEMLFYMMSRGLAKKKALKILERASIEAAANHIEDDGIREYVLGIIAEKYANE